MRGNGASANGDLPFLRSFNINTKESKEIWRCAEPYYETVSSITDFDKMIFITSKQSQNETPNYYQYTNDTVKQLTAFADPQPALRGVTKQKITYKRKDGVDLYVKLLKIRSYIISPSSKPDIGILEDRHKIFQKINLEVCNEESLENIEIYIKKGIYNTKFKIRGLCFYPNKSGTKLIYLFSNTNNQTNNSNTNNQTNNNIAVKKYFTGNLPPPAA